VCQPVALVHDNATVATTLATNISAGGMQTVCDRYTTDALHPSAVRLTRASAPRIDAHFKLPVNGALVKFDIECRLAYVTAVEDSQYCIGLEFFLLADGCLPYLAQFLREAVLLDEG
jgi:hypothetical protein